MERKGFFLHRNGSPSRREGGRGSGRRGERDKRK